MTTALTILFMAVALLLILVILVQRGRGGGLSGAFGAGGGSTSAFGTKTGDVFTTLTVVLFVVFMLLAIWLNLSFKYYKPVIAGGLREAPATATAPAALGTRPDMVKSPAAEAPVTPLPAPASQPATQPR